MMVKLRWLKHWLSRYLFLVLLLSSVSITTMGCTGSTVLSSLLGGGPKVAANTQIGKTNQQTIGQTNTVAPQVSVRPKARVETIDQSNKTENTYTNQPWLIIAFALAVLLDSPIRIVQDIFTKFSKRKDKRDG